VSTVESEKALTGSLVIEMLVIPALVVEIWPILIVVPLGDVGFVDCESVPKN
jgi:nitrate reductase NapE component